MTLQHNRSFPIFVSSLCKELWDLRARIYHEVGSAKTIYVDEQVNRRHIAVQDDLETADDLIRRVREADVFVCILGGTRHGTLINTGGRESSTSFFEIELFQAALLRKEIHLFVRTDFAPEPRLEALLNILRFAFPEWATRLLQTEAEILDQMKKLAYSYNNRSFARRSLAMLHRTPIARLVQGLHTARVRGTHSSSLLFLNGTTEAHRLKPEPDQIVLASVRDQLQNQRDEERLLSRLWIGIRELMCTDYRHLHDKDLLAYWNLFFAEWARAGAWYGLHGDTPLGCLAALNSITLVRQTLAVAYGKAHSPHDTAFPGGSLASAKYSIAKQLYIRADRVSRFREALQDLERARTEGIEDLSNLLAIRGSICLQLGHRSQAVEDYEKVVQLRVQNNARTSALGEALSELGFGYLRQGRLHAGLDYCRKGVEYLRNGARPGFLARALRKLAIAYILNGRFVKAYGVREEAYRVANESHALDQQ